MPRRKSRADVYKDKVYSAIISKQYEEKPQELSEPLPPPQNVKEYLEEKYQICSNRNFRVILVEDLGNYKIFIQTPGDKSECDFYVWRTIYENNELVDLKVPSHDDLGKMYLQLKTLSENINEYLINSLIKFIKNRWSIKQTIEKYFKNEPQQNINQLIKFYATLKWIALQEDTNYPPPKLGSKYTLAVYALLEAGFTLTEIRRIIRF